MIHLECLLKLRRGHDEKSSGLRGSGGGLRIYAGTNRGSGARVHSGAGGAGEDGFESVCAQCHTDRLTGRDGTGEIPEIARPYGGKIPPLAGANAAFPPFLTKWGPRTTKALSKRISDAAGGFKPEGMTAKTYLDITAYVLQVNGAKAGTEELTAETAVEINSLVSADTTPVAQR